MSVPVYLAGLAVKNPSDHRLAKIKRLCDAVGLADKVRPLGKGGEDEVVAIKLHFGESGNDTYLHPTFARQVVDCVKAAGARPFLADTCTLYKSTRHNAVDHLETAYRHGFTPYVVDAPVIIADGVTSRCYEEVPVNLKHFATVKIAQAFRSANAMVVLSHFKGHAFGGFGGAIKNLAMGCAPQAGKIDQHGRNVVISPNCIGCGQCVKSCPQEALRLEKAEKGRRAVLDASRCIGCYECVSVCRQGRPHLLPELPDERYPAVRLRRVVRTGHRAGHRHPRLHRSRRTGHGLFRSGEERSEPRASGRTRAAFLRIRQVRRAASEHARLASGGIRRIHRHGFARLYVGNHLK